jgi:hypothetical protein
MTLYGHFIGGETKNELQLQVEKLKVHHVKVILDHYMESDISQNPHRNLRCGSEKIDSSPTAHSSFLKIYHPDEITFNTNMFKYIKNVETTRLLCGSKSFTAIKLTPLIRPSLLEKLSKFCHSNTKSRQLADLLTILPDHASSSLDQSICSHLRMPCRISL